MGCGVHFISLSSQSLMLPSERSHPCIIFVLLVIAHKMRTW